MRHFKPYIPAILSAALLALSFPPVGLGFLAFVALVPMLNSFETMRLRDIFFRFWLSGTLFFGATVFWMKYVTWAGMILAVITLGALYAIPFFAAGCIRKRFSRLWLFALPFCIAGFEWARSFDPFAFPWMIFGNSQAGYPRLIQFADITSVYGVSWWVVMVNVAALLLVRKRTVARFAFIALLFLAPFAYSFAVLHTAPPPGKTITVAIVQGNVPQDEKWGGDIEWNIDLYFSMSRKAAARRPDLIVWPETAIPTYVLQDAYYLLRVRSFVDTLGIPVLTGIPTVDLNFDLPEEKRRTWNSAGLFVPGSADVQRYDKIHLVPFGEAFPLDNYFPSLRKIDLGQANWDEGQKAVVFKTPSLPPFHVAICFESIFPDLNRKFIRKGSEFITVITNDAWFGPKTAPIQHAMIAAMRAVEFHRPVVRCANTGISMFIDPYGRIVSRTATFERTTLFGTIAPRSDMTFYARFGNLFGIGSALIAVILLIAAIPMCFGSGEGKKHPGVS
jgi:apolipoprotein N-acyltransferase